MYVLYIDVWGTCANSNERICFPRLMFLVFANLSAYVSGPHSIYLKYFTIIKFKRKKIGRSHTHTATRGTKNKEQSVRASVKVSDFNQR